MKKLISHIKLNLYSYKSKSRKNLGINLIGLMISSALGAFMIAVIIKVTITVSNNYQLIKGIAELQRSARILDNLFNKFFTANGFGITDLSNKVNQFNIKNNNNQLDFSIWYAGSRDDLNGGLNDCISCSGRQLESTNAAQQLTISISNSVDNNNLGSLTCGSEINGSSTGNMPLIKSKQLVRFYAATMVEDPNQPGNLQIIPVTFSNAQPLSNPVLFNSFGIKLAFILRTSLPVLNVDRTTSFDNIFGVANFAFTATDKFLYKLVIIESPFFNRQDPTTNTIIQTSIIQST